MSVAELRSRLIALVDALPVAELIAALEAAESARADMTTAWRGSGHPASEAAPAALSAALDELHQTVASLEECRTSVADYIERL